MPEKSKGILAFASNTATVDYHSIAQRTMTLASCMLGLPYTIVSPEQPVDWKNYRLDIDTKQPVTWNNYGRHMAYEVSPYDQTLVLDVDYLVTTDRLLDLFATDQDLICCHDNQSLSKPSFYHQELRPVWATVFYFTKTPRTKQFFELVGKVQRNWEYYRTFFGIPQIQYRNDYAFAMAELVINGYIPTASTNMPWHITTVDQAPDSIDINQNWIVIREQTGATVLPRQDLHVMSKTWLQSTALDEFIQKAQQ